MDNRCLGGQGCDIIRGHGFWSDLLLWTILISWLESIFVFFFFWRQTIVKKKKVDYFILDRKLLSVITFHKKYTAL